MVGDGGRGGILGLAELVGEHGGALEYDLLTKTGYQLSDIGGALSWGALRHFVERLDHTSALWQETHPDEASLAGWLDGSLVAPLLAELFDVMAINAWVSANKGARHKRPKPKPYPRPWLSQSSTKHIGKDPIPISEFDAWWESKRKESGNG